MIKSNNVKALHAQGKPAFGTWNTLCPHPRLVKILAASGFDFVIIGMEHSDFNMETVGALAIFARECDIVPVVRPPGTMKPHDLTRPLDAEADESKRARLRQIVNREAQPQRGGRMKRC